jgi:hypothetical protein
VGMDGNGDGARGIADNNRGLVRQTRAKPTCLLNSN